MSVGRVTDEYVYTQEPSVSDQFIVLLCEAVNESLRSSNRLAAAAGATPGSNHESALPFELRALEAALHEACRLLEVEVTGAITEANQQLCSRGQSRVRPRS